jgi:hypothetical protein
MTRHSSPLHILRRYLTPYSWTALAFGTIALVTEASRWL